MRPFANRTFSVHVSIWLFLQSQYVCQGLSWPLWAAGPAQSNDLAPIIQHFECQSAQLMQPVVPASIRSGAKTGQRQLLLGSNPACQAA